MRTPGPTAAASASPRASCAASPCACQVGPAGARDTPEQHRALGSWWSRAEEAPGRRRRSGGHLPACRATSHISLSPALQMLRPRETMKMGRTRLKTQVRPGSRHAGLPGAGDRPPTWGPAHQAGERPRSGGHLRGVPLAWGGGDACPALGSGWQVTGGMGHRAVGRGPGPGTPGAAGGPVWPGLGE